MEPTNLQPGQVISPIQTTVIDQASPSDSVVEKVKAEIETKTASAWSRFWKDQIVIKTKRTFLQAFTVTFFAGLADLLKAFAHGGLATAEAALLALIVGAASAGIAAVGGLLEAYVKATKAQLGD